VGDREMMEKYLNSAYKNKSETDIFPQGTKCLLTSVIGRWSEFESPSSTKTNSFSVTFPQPAMVDIFAVSESVEGEEEEEKERY
jgi:hypothetical protein